MQKIKIALSSLMLLWVSFSACHKDLDSNSDLQNVLNTEHSGIVEDRAAPVISSITSDFNPWTNGGYGFNTTCNSWETNKFWAVNQGTTITTFTINGSGFGTNPTVTLTNATNYTMTVLPNPTTSKIKIKVVPNSTSAQQVNATLKITNGSQSISKAMPIVPHVYTRQFRQCTWWATVRRIDSNTTPQPEGNSYLTSYSNMNADYIPQAKDVLMWFYYDTNNKPVGHQAFLESVSTVTTPNPAGQPVGTTDYEYTLSISQYNISCEAYSTFSKVIKVRKKPNGVKTILSGNYNHPNLGNSYNNGNKKYYR